MMRKRKRKKKVKMMQVTAKAAMKNQTDYSGCTNVWL